MDELADLKARVSALEQKLEVVTLLPEPLVDKVLVPALTPCTEGCLKTFLRKYRAEFPPRYRYIRRDNGKTRTRIRILSLSEIQRIRNALIRKDYRIDLKAG
jgi:hypothetical protein